MKNGFFTISSEDDYDFLETLNVNNKIINAFYYLHGICHEFALALNEIFGYDIVLWINFDEDIHSNALVHAFNTFTYNGKQYYVDVRGITDDLNDIIDEFDYYEDLIDVIGHNKKDSQNILKELGLNTEINDDIYKTINAYKTYYQLSF